MVIANSALALLFAAFFAYTFWGRRHIDHLARGFVSDKTKEFAGPLVDLAEEALASKVIRKLLTVEQIAAFEAEIAEYRNDPSKYICELTGQRVPAAMRESENPWLAKITEWKRKVRDHYNRVLAKLCWDLRIFAGSNVVAGGLAVWFAHGAREKGVKKLAWISFFLLVAVVYCAYLYVDSFSFFTILFDSYMGWWYPVLVVVTFIVLYVEYARMRDAPA